MRSLIRHRKLISTIVVALLVIGGLLYYRLHHPPRVEQYTLTELAPAITEDIKYVFDITGIVFDDAGQYLGSRYGSEVNNSLKEGRWVNNRIITSVAVQTKEFSTCSYCFFVTVTTINKAGGRPRIRRCAGENLCCLPETRTSRILKSITQNPVDLERTCKKLRVGSFFLYHKTYTQFPFTQKASDLPSYYHWLKGFFGRKTDFLDGWGHAIKFALDDKHNFALLIASSAGSDGKWGTKDDMVVKRDTKTGKIVEEVEIQ